MSDLNPFTIAADDEVSNPDDSDAPALTGSRDIFVEQSPKPDQNWMIDGVNGGRYHFGTKEAVKRFVYRQRKKKRI